MSRGFPLGGVRKLGGRARELARLDPAHEILGVLADPGAVLELDRGQLRLAGVLLDRTPAPAHERLLDVLVRDAGVLNGLEDLPARVPAVDPGVGTRVNLDRHAADATPKSVRCARYVCGSLCRRSSSTRSSRPPPISPRRSTRSWRPCRTSSAS